MNIILLFYIVAINCWTLNVNIYVSRGTSFKIALSKNSAAWPLNLLVTCLLCHLFPIAYPQKCFKCFKKIQVQECLLCRGRSSYSQWELSSCFCVLNSTWGHMLPWTAPVDSSPAEDFNKVLQCLSAFIFVPIGNSFNRLSFKFH